MASAKMVYEEYEVTTIEERETGEIVLTLTAEEAQVLVNLYHFHIGGELSGFRAEVGQVSLALRDAGLRPSYPVTAHGVVGVLELAS